VAAAARAGAAEVVEPEAVVVVEAAALVVGSSSRAVESRRGDRLAARSEVSAAHEDRGPPPTTRCAIVCTKVLHFLILKIQEFIIFFPFNLCGQALKFGLPLSIQPPSPKKKTFLSCLAASKPKKKQNKTKQNKTKQIDNIFCGL
jgi:hypothetical protein